MEFSQFLTNIQTTFKKSNPDLVYDPNKKIEWIPSGDIIYDLVSGGGFPRKKITEIFGMEHSCKSSMVISGVAQTQKQGGVAVFLDFEQSFDAKFYGKIFDLSVDNKHVFVFQPTSIEEGAEIIDMILNDFTGDLDFLGLDSVDAMKPKAMIDSKLGESSAKGQHAQAMGKFVTKTLLLIKKFNCAVAYVNQMRAEITLDKFKKGMGTGHGFKAKEDYTTTGGLALRYYSHIRMKTEYGGADDIIEQVIAGDGDKGKTRIGNKIRIVNVKNKVSMPFLKSETYFGFPSHLHQGGFDEGRAIISLLRNKGKIVQKGPKFVYDGLHKEFSNIGSKVDSERKFSEDPVLMKDAKEFLWQELENFKLYKESLFDTASEEEVVGSGGESMALAKGGTMNIQDLIKKQDVPPEEPLDEVSLNVDEGSVKDGSVKDGDNT